MKNCCKLKRLVLDFKNQRGLATLEVILVVTIIAILSTIALPKMARMVDVAQLDYEMKIFMSTLDYAKSLNRNIAYTPEIFSSSLEKPGSTLQLSIKKNPAGYTLKSDTPNLFEPHNLPTGFSITDTLDGNIYFTKPNNGNVIITSPFGNKRYIIFDTVGRWRGDINPPQ